MAPEPGATRSPRKGPGHGAVDRRGEISLVRARVAAATGRVDHERLERLPPRVDACAGKDRKSTRLNSSHDQISYAVFCLKKKNILTASTSFGQTPLAFESAKGKAAGPLEAMKVR